MIEIVKTWITGKPAGTYLATVSMEIAAGAHRFQIRGMRLVEVKGKKVLAMPSRRTTSGWQDLVHPLTPETREMLQLAAISEFEKARGTDARDLFEPL